MSLCCIRFPIAFRFTVASDTQGTPDFLTVTCSLRRIMAPLTTRRSKKQNANSEALGARKQGHLDAENVHHGRVTSICTARIGTLANNPAHYKSRATFASATNTTHPHGTQNKNDRAQAAQPSDWLRSLRGLPFAMRRSRVFAAEPPTPPRT